MDSQSSFRDSLRRFAGGTFWMVVEGLAQDGQGLRRAREEAERASVNLLSGLWDGISTWTCLRKSDYCVCTLIEVERDQGLDCGQCKWLAAEFSGGFLMI